MKWLLKWALRLIFLLLLLAVLFVVFLDSIARTIAQRHIRAQTGMDVTIGKFSVGLLAPTVTIENLKLYNTADFGGTPFLDIPDLHFEYDRGALASRKLHFKLMRFSLAELDVVKNEKGQTNIFEFKKGVPAKNSRPGGKQKVKSDFAFGGIDMLNLSLGKARFIDLKEPRNNWEIQFNLQNQIVKNVKSEEDLTGVLMLLWLRNGGGFGLTPADVMKSFLGGKWNRDIVPPSKR